MAVRWQAHDLRRLRTADRGLARIARGAGAGLVPCVDVYVLVGLAPWLRHPDPIACAIVIQKMARSDRGCFGGAAVALLGAALAAACGGSVSGPPGNDGAPLSIDALPGQLANAACENLGACCNAAAIPFDQANCRANWTAGVEMAVKRVLQESRVRYDASAAGACVAAYRDYFKRCLDQGDNAVDAVCNRMFVGAVELGGACSRSDECAPSATGSGWCSFDARAETAQGVCVAPELADSSATTHGKLGEACAGSCESGADCGVLAPTGTTPSVTKMCFADDGLQCDFDTGTCQPPSTVGQACRFGGCVKEAYCSAAGVCAPKKPDGTACTDDGECNTGDCLFPGADSSTTNRVCGAKNLATPGVCSAKFD